MRDWLIGLCAAFGTVTLIYLLYRSGVAVTRSIVALVFVFRTGRDGDSVTLKSCTGWVRHVGRFRERGSCQFVFEAQLSKGDAEVLLLDGKKREILRFNRRSPAGRAELAEKERYFLRWEFKSATGTCRLRW